MGGLISANDGFANGLEFYDSSGQPPFSAEHTYSVVLGERIAESEGRWEFLAYPFPSRNEVDGPTQTSSGQFSVRLEIPGTPVVHFAFETRDIPANDNFPSSREIIAIQAGARGKGTLSILTDSGIGSGTGSGRVAVAVETERDEDLTVLKLQGGRSVFFREDAPLRQGGPGGQALGRQGLQAGREGRAGPEAIPRPPESVRRAQVLRTQLDLEGRDQRARAGSLQRHDH